MSKERGQRRPRHPIVERVRGVVAYGRGWQRKLRAGVATRRHGERERRDWPGVRAPGSSAARRVGAAWLCELWATRPPCVMATGEKKKLRLKPNTEPMEPQPKSSVSVSFSNRSVSTFVQTEVSLNR